MNKQKTAEEHLREWIELSQVTQTELAMRLGVTRAAVSKWCSGSMAPSPGRAAMLEKLTLGVVPASLWPRRPAPEASTKGAKALQKAASKLGCSIPELSRATGIPGRALYRWMLGQHSPRKSGIVKLNETLGLKLTVRDFEVAA